MFIYILTRKMFRSVQYLERSGLTEMLIGLKLFLIAGRKDFFFRRAKLKLQGEARLILCSKRKVIPLFVIVWLTLRSRNKNKTRMKHEQRTTYPVFCLSEVSIHGFSITTYSAVRFAGKEWGGGGWVGEHTRRDKQAFTIWSCQST